jgi:8-oxo-dGTP diphosphatase
LPGGGRENDEAPDECALRELFEEFGLKIDAARIIWRCEYPSWSNPGTKSFFMGAHLADEEIAQIQFGSEGQHWEMMPTGSFLTHERAVPHLQERLRDFLAAPR